MLLVIFYLVLTTVTKTTTMKTKANIKTFHDAKDNVIALEGLIPLFSRKQDEDSKSWIIFSPHLNTFGYSTESQEKAVVDFQRAIKVFFDVHKKRGTLEKALLTFGWTKESNTATSICYPFLLPKLKRRVK